MAHPTTLNDAQSKVLEWIEAGCPPGQYEGVSHRITAAALARRGLVKVTGHGPAWKAAVTGDGKAYLEQMRSPNPPTPRQANASVTQQLVDDVVAAGGTKRFLYSDHDLRSVDYERRAGLAHRYGKVPAGKQLIVRRDGDGIEVSLIDSSHDTPDAVTSVPVPVRVAKFHPLVSAFRSDPTRHEVSRAELPRACRILHALIVEASRRGYTVQLARSRPAKYGNGQLWTGPNDGHLTVDVGDYTAAVRISEEGLGSRSFWEAENDRHVRTSTGNYVQRNRPISDYEKNATGRLTIELLGTGRNTYRPGRWSDRRSWRLDDKVGEVLWEIEARAADARVARKEAERVAEERERRRQAALVQAERDLIEQRRGDALRSQVNAWREARRIRDYCAAIAIQFPDDPDASDWREWALAFANRIDPMRRPPSIPPIGEIRPSDLQAHLTGWSVYGSSR
jgi:hypothetical protein